MDAGAPASLRSGAMSQWRCRLCGFDRYHRVAVIKKNGQRYETAFFACSDCSVMFLNDTTFNGLRGAAADREPPAIVTPLRPRR